MVLSTMVRSSCRMWHNFSFFLLLSVMCGMILQVFFWRLCSGVFFVGFLK